MGAKVTFDPITRIISVVDTPTNGEINHSVAVDLYSDGKEDWLANETLRRLRFPIRVIGGDPTPTDFVGSTFFLSSDWKLRPYEGNHRYILNGNFFSEDGTSIFTDTVGTWRIRTEQVVSNLVDKIQAGSGLNASQDAALTTILNLLEADEIHTAASIIKYLKGTNTELLNKTVAGSQLPETLSITDTP